MNFLRKLTGTLRWVANHPLHRHHKFEAMVNFSVAQVASRLVPGDVCVPFPNQTWLLVPPRMKGAAHFIMPTLTEFDTMSFVLHFLRRDDLFVDAGTYVGAYTVLAGGAVGARSISFEPSPATFACLLRNVRLNNLTDRVTLVNSALGSEEGVLRFTDELGTENYVCQNAKTTGRSIEVKVTTLDAALAGLDPTLLKMDVEGFESKALAGASETLAKPCLAAFIIERQGNANRYGEDEAALHERIRGQSFIPCAYSPLDRVLRKLGPDDQGDIIYVRDFVAVQKRLKEASPYRFAGRSI